MDVIAQTMVKKLTAKLHASLGYARKRGRRHWTDDLEF